MIFSIGFTKKAEGQFNKLELDVKKRIVESLDRIKVRPHSFVKRLVGSKYFRLRVGDYRVILDINDGALIIMVIEVGHRKKIYK